MRDYMRNYNAKKSAEKKKLVDSKPKSTAKKPRSRPGDPTKSTIAADNFNSEKLIQPSPSDLKRARDILDLPDDIEKEDSELADIFENDEDAIAMLNDIRYIYKHAGGRKKLMGMAKSDNKNFVALIKELVKVETAILTAKVRKNSNNGPMGGDRQNFFVVLKGLHNDKVVVDAMENDSIDYEQIERALNPHSVNDSTYQDEMEANIRDQAPELLLGHAETVEEEDEPDLDDILGIDNLEDILNIGGREDERHYSWE